MKSKIKLWWGQLRCPHERIDVVRWHVIDYNPYSEPTCINAKYQCSECGKEFGLKLVGQDAQEWVRVMGDYKRTF